MDREEHKRLARRALEAGLLDPADYERLVDELARGGDPVDVESFWVARGKLRRDQIESLLRVENAPDPSAVSGDAGTMLGLGGRPPAVPANATRSWERPPRPGGSAPEEPPLFAERYRPHGVKGVGGSGRVLECEDTRLNRRVAVKVPHPELSHDAQVVRSLRREAELTGQLEHPGIVPIYDLADPGESPFYVMRLLEQPTLAEVIARLRAGDERASSYTLGRLLFYFVQVCLAVDFAHSRGVLHCDLKPSNILVGEFGDVLVLDWGMAHRPGAGEPRQGGTPGYMAPEQLDPKREIDVSADVFALGAILYEILCQERLYPTESLPSFGELVMGAADYPPVEPLSARRPDLAVPEELESICLRALRFEPSERYQSARDVATAIEAFLEGSKERERRFQRAEELVGEGRMLEEMYDDYVASRPSLVQEVSRVRSEVAPWEPPERKQEVWNAEDRLAATDSMGARTFHAAVAAYEHATEEVPGHPEARRGLARLYWTELQRARQRRDRVGVLYFDQLVKQYDDGTIEALRRGTGDVELTCPGGDAEVYLHHYEEHDRRLVRGDRIALGRAPIRAELEPGSRLLEIVPSSGAPVTVPLLVEPGRSQSVAVELARARTLRAGERLVTGGLALLGGAETSPFGIELAAWDVADFAIAERPVTLGEYIEFLSAMAAGDPAAAERYLPRSSTGAPYWTIEGREIVPTSAWPGTRRSLLDLPALGIDAESAAAFAAWRADRTGLPFRLPREDEWEKAARGVDGRIYPWGDYFDASFCKMAQSREGRAYPEPPGSFPTDVSPYGVRDTAGGIAEWVIAAEARQPLAGASRDAGSWAVVRGGAWCDWEQDCRLDLRRRHEPGFRSARIGFRLARTIG